MPPFNSIVDHLIYAGVSGVSPPGEGLITLPQWSLVGVMDGDPPTGSSKGI